MSKKIVLIGAGSVQFGLGTLGDIFQCKALEGSHVVLHDIDAQALAVVEREARRYIDEHGLPFELSATTERKEAVRDRHAKAKKGSEKLAKDVE